MNIKDFIVNTSSPEAYAALKHLRFCDYVVQSCQVNLPEVHKLLIFFLNLRKDNINSGIELRVNDLAKIKFIDENIEKELKLIDNDFFRVGLIPNLFKTLEEYILYASNLYDIVKSFPEDTKQSIFEFEAIFLNMYDYVPTTQYLMVAEIDKNYSEVFIFVKELLSNEFETFSNVDELEGKSYLINLEKIVLKFLTLAIFEVNYYSYLLALRKSFDEASAIPNDGSSLTIEQRKSIVTEELAFMSGNDKIGRPIMSDNDFKRMINYIQELVTSNGLPTVEKKIPATKTTMGEIRHAHYIIYKRIFSAKGHIDRFVDFLHATFEQFTCEKSTTKTKFSTPPRGIN